MRPVVPVLAAFALAASPGSPAGQPAAAADPVAEVAAPTAARTQLAVTLYTDGIALVRDRRSVTLPAGLSEVAIEAVAPRLVPASVIVASADARVTGVRYDFQLLTNTALLARSLGQEVMVIRPGRDGGEEKAERATLLAVDGGIVLRFADRIETQPAGRIAFTEVPRGLRAKPTLLAGIDAGGGGRRDIDVSYMAPGIDWSADYVVTLDPARDRLALAGRAIVSNRAGVDLPGAAVALVAGDLNRVTPLPPPAGKGRGMQATEMMAMPAASPDALPAREALGDAWLYTLPQPVSLADQETRQLPLLDAADVAVSVEYVSRRDVMPFAAVEGVQRSHPDLRLTFVNPAAGSPGVPLPGGIARVFMADQGGTPRLIGEDRLAPTPVGEKATLVPGTAFDVTVSRRQTAFSRIDMAQNVHEAAYAITVRNAKAKPAVVRVVEDIPGDWQILQESAAHEKTGANRAEWPLTVPAGGSVELAYRVRVRQ
jgi:hypothetical protein